MASKGMWCSSSCSSSTRVTYTSPCLRRHTSNEACSHLSSASSSSSPLRSCRSHQGSIIRRHGWCAWLLLYISLFTLYLSSRTHDHHSSIFTSSPSSSLLSSSSLSPSFLFAEAKVSSGKLVSHKSWHYLDKFCFDESGGLVTFQLDGDPTIGDQYIAFYADMESQWPAVYGSDMSCQWKLDLAGRNVFPIARNGQKSEYADSPIVLIVEGRRPRWWYMAMVNCNNNGSDAVTNSSLYVSHYLGSGGINVQYDLTMTNEGGKWRYQFSKDEQDIGGMTIFFFWFDLALLVTLYFSKVAAKKRGMQYHVIKHLAVSVLFHVLAQGSYWIHLQRYSDDGIGHPLGEQVQFFFDFMSVLTLLHIVLNMARGWPVSTNYVAGRRVTYTIIFAYMIAYVALFAWDVSLRDPASVLYIYESAPGYAIVAFRMLTILWYLYTTYRTRAMETDAVKRVFYIIFSLFAVAWLVALPLIVLIAHYLNSWDRKKVVYGMVNSIHTLSFWILWAFFMPWRSNFWTLILNPTETRAFGNNNMQIFPSLPLSNIATSA